MSDEQRPERPFATIPDRPPLREIARRETPLSDTESDMRRIAIETHQRSISIRSEARRDAMIVVSRARERRGPTNAQVWSALEADTIHAITDLLLQIQGQDPGTLDPAFAARDETLARSAKMSGQIEEAVRRQTEKGGDPHPAA
jgi:hypothetical protein